MIAPQITCEDRAKQITALPAHACTVPATLCCCSSQWRTEFHPASFQASSSNPVASIHGVVLNATNEGGLRKAFLRLAPAFGSGNDIAYTAVTNDQGAFTIKDVAPGSYRLEAECIGFLNAQYGGGSPENAGIGFRLSAGDDLKGIEIKMTPQAVLAGRVLDPDGYAWPHAGLSGLHSVWHKGKQRIEAASTSDYLIGDRGEFRISALVPGRYYLLAVPDALWEKQHRSCERPTRGSRTACLVSVVLEH